MKSRLHLGAILLSLGGACGAASFAAETYDVLIRGGRLLDGTGSPWRYADVAIRGDRIVRVGPIAAAATAGRVIEAKGKYLAPASSIRIPMRRRESPPRHSRRPGRYSIRV